MDTRWLARDKEGAVHVLRERGEARRDPASLLPANPKTDGKAGPTAPPYPTNMAFLAPPPPKFASSPTKHFLIVYVSSFTLPLAIASGTMPGKRTREID